VEKNATKNHGVAGAEWPHQILVATESVAVKTILDLSLKWTVLCRGTVLYAQRNLDLGSQKRLLSRSSSSLAT